MDDAGPLYHYALISDNMAAIRPSMRAVNELSI
jgi:hypothetical protein